MNGRDKELTTNYTYHPTQKQITMKKQVSKTITKPLQLVK